MKNHQTATMLGGGDIQIPNLNQYNTSSNQGRLSNFESSSKKPSLTDRTINQCNLNHLIDYCLVERNKTGGFAGQRQQLGKGVTEKGDVGGHATQFAYNEQVDELGGYQYYDQSITDCNSISENFYRAQQNMVQRRFPMLREYERSKRMFSMSPTDSRLNQNQSSAYYDYQQQKNKSSFHQQKATKPTSFRQSDLFLAKNSSLGSTFNQLKNNDTMRESNKFLLSNKSDARNTIKASNFGLHWDQKYHDIHKMIELEEKELKKKGMLGGDFKPAYLNNKIPGIARKNDDSFLATAHTFDTFMGEREDLPRLSILSNYEQIMRIMTTNYMKSKELDHRYRNQDKKNLKADEEYAQYSEEQKNSRKMSNILQRLRTPKKRTNINYFYREQIKKEMNIPSTTNDFKQMRSQMNNYQRAKVDIQLKAMRFDKLNRCNTANTQSKQTLSMRQTIPIQKGFVKLNEQSNKDLPQIHEVSLTDSPSIQSNGKLINEGKDQKLISMNDIIEIKTFVHPSPDVVTVMCYFMLLFKEEATWDRVRHFFQDAVQARNIINTLDFEQLDGNSKNFKEIAAFIEQYPKTESFIDKIKQSSLAVANFAEFLVMVYKRVKGRSQYQMN